MPRIQRGGIGREKIISDQIQTSTLSTSGDVTIGGDLNAAGDVTISDVNVTGEIKSNTFDSFSAATLKLGPTKATKIEISDSGVDTEIQGLLVATEFITSDEIDTVTATTLLIGRSTATKVEIADTGITTEIQGPLVATEFITSDEIDTVTATPLLIGKTTATKVEIADTGIDTEIMGNLHINGTVIQPTKAALSYYRSTVQTITTNTATIVKFGSSAAEIQYEVGSGFTWSANRFTNTSGVVKNYSVNVILIWEADNVDQRRLWITAPDNDAATVNAWRNKGTKMNLARNYELDATEDKRQLLNSVVRLEDDEFFEVGCLQTSGGDLDISSSLSNRYDLYNNIVITEI